MRQRGFTLLEIIIAIGIFAILWALTFGGWQAVQKARSETDRQAKRLTEVEITMSYLARDISQTMIDRPVRDEYGGQKPAIQGGAGSNFALELTRGGWRNPAGQTRSTLQRVAYGVDETTLVRHAWQVLDRAQDSKPLDAKLLTGVTSFKVRFLHFANHQWLEDWPPPTQNNAPQETKPPLAVELTLELEDLGKIGRLFRVPG